jgi:hypothetical protein
VAELQVPIQAFQDAVEGTDGTDMEADADDEGDDDGRATPVVWDTGFHSASSVNELRSQPRRRRPSDSLAAHRHRLHG